MELSALLRSANEPQESSCILAKPLGSKRLAPDCSQNGDGNGRHLYSLLMILASRCHCDFLRGSFIQHLQCRTGVRAVGSQSTHYVRDNWGDLFRNFWQLIDMTFAIAAWQYWKPFVGDFWTAWPLGMRHRRIPERSWRGLDMASRAGSDLFHLGGSNIVQEPQTK